MISVITPVHKTSTPYLVEAYASLCAQTHGDWEWVLCPNAGGRVPLSFSDDLRIRVYPIEDNLDANGHNSVGRIKHIAFTQGRGDVLVEFDADDLLTPNALERIAKVFADERVMLAYSNSAEFEDGTWKPNIYSEYWGWRSRPFTYQDHELVEMVAWEPSAQMMRRIEWAPNHVRAFRTSAYTALGGHDETLATGDDHDLCCRFYLAYGQNGLRHIDECLYLYRVHNQNTCRVNNAGVQNQTHTNYLKYVRQLATRWARDNKLGLLDLGGRFNAWDGYTTVDRYEADVLADLEKSWTFAADNSIGVVHAAHIFEHLHDPIATMNQLYRVLAPGGFAFIEVPSTDGRGAWQDPTHVSFWNQNSFGYYTKRDFARFIQPEFTGRFQASFITTYYPTQFERDHNIPIVLADLIAIKSPYADRAVGEVLI